MRVSPGKYCEHFNACSKQFREDGFQTTLQYVPSNHVIQSKSRASFLRTLRKFCNYFRVIVACISWRISWDCDQHLLDLAFLSKMRGHPMAAVWLRVSLQMPTPFQRDMRLEDLSFLGWLFCLWVIHFQGSSIIKHLSKNMAHHSGWFSSCELCVIWSLVSLGNLVFLADIRNCIFSDHHLPCKKMFRAATSLVESWGVSVSVVRH